MWRSSSVSSSAVSGIGRNLVRAALATMSGNAIVVVNNNLSPRGAAR
jgi:hypothetical protein